MSKQRIAIGIVLIILIALMLSAYTPGGRAKSRWLATPTPETVGVQSEDALLKSAPREGRGGPLSHDPDTIHPTPIDILGVLITPGPTEESCYYLYYSCAEMTATVNPNWPYPANEGE